MTARHDPESIDAPIEPPSGCLTSEAHEIAFTAAAQWLTELAQEHEEDPAAVAKLMAEATKARRAASVLVIRRESDVVLARLDRNRRAMTAGGTQRAPLRVVNGGPGH